ncbi:hypothetical protein GH714_038270 [Hevea brasiliensis]|uniref:Uncharacterized protein n=1 Tax=Hevea brasiliensis TaxID=3981 RepID=A0A6A6KGB6_HEVBR|nr:hypothetical protein GH714_038270 [Hevea brasiliensis]
MRPIPDILVSEHQDPEVSQDPTIAELSKLARKAKQNMVIENPRLQNLEEQMQSQNQKIQDLSAGLHRMEEMMSHRMEEMMSQMMELMKASQGKDRGVMDIREGGGLRMPSDGFCGGLGISGIGGRGGEKRVIELLENETQKWLNQPLLEGSDENQVLCQRMILKTGKFLAFLLELFGVYGGGKFKWCYGCALL